MILNVKNETSRLRAVVLGQPNSMGMPPTKEQAYDAKSYESILNDDYPHESDIIQEMNAFHEVFRKHHVQVFRPWVLEDCNQVFARDVGFVVDDVFILSNLIPARADEQEAYELIFNSISADKFIKLPENVHVEGGDVILWNDFVFVGCYREQDYPQFKTARTNAAAVDFLKELFPHKWVISFELEKNDYDPYQGILHLDCAFQPVGHNKAIVYPQGFRNKAHFELIKDLFGADNLFIVNQEEMYLMFPNVFSIAPDVVVSENNFTRLIRHMREDWGITVEEIPYREISKMGGLLRCSTMPLIRD